MKLITLLFITFLSSCSFQETPNNKTDLDKTVRVYDMNDNLLTENIIDGSENIENQQIVRVYDMNDNLLTENIVGN
jgi:hypothetical protein